MRWHSLARLMAPLAGAALVGCNLLDPCALQQCAAHEQCEVQEQCTADECGQEAVCVAGDTPPTQPPGVTCASVLCIEGTYCVDDPLGGPRCIPSAADAGEPDNDQTCATLECPLGSSCTVSQGEAVCISDPLPPAPTSCAVVTCIVGTVCIETDTGARCVPQEESPCNLVDCPPDQPNCEVVGGEAVCKANPGASCAATLCPTNTYCDDISGQAVCIPLPSCDAESCEAGQHCELQQVQCIRAPCPAIPTCVADER